MNTLTDREQWDIQKVLEDKNYYSCMPDRHKTKAVSLVAAFVCGHNLEYVPEAILNKDICRMALKSGDVDCSVLSHIPYPDVQKEGIRKFAGNTPAFVLYSHADIGDAEMAQDAVKADAYCIQLVPKELLTKDLCKTALQSPNSDGKVSKFVMERFPELQTKYKGGKFQKKAGVRMKF